MFVLPRLSFKLAFFCITFFSSAVWFTARHAFHLTAGSAIRHSLDGVLANVVITEPKDDPIWNIRNRTLGFQKIFAVSMPHRTDKRDYLALMAHVSGLDITAVDGVNGSLMHPHAIPSSFTEGGSGTYGCWRAHLNIYQRMLREQIQSALIFEDDADWDVFLRAQMTEFARGTRYITNSTTPLHSPYGDDWDILTIGHTGVDNKPARDGGYWITENDPTVIAESRRGWSRKPDLTVPALSGPHTRLVHTVRRMTGTASYAISLRGASRVLYDQTMLPNAAAIDVALSNMCRLERWTPNFCIGSYPMLIGRYRAAGPKVKDSDRRSELNKEEPDSQFQPLSERLEPESEFTVFPVSLNIGCLLKGETVVPANDPKTDLMKQVDLSVVVLPEGRPVYVKSEEYQLFNQQIKEIKDQKAFTQPCRKQTPEPEKQAEDCAKTIIPK